MKLTSSVLPLTLAAAALTFVSCSKNEPSSSGKPAGSAASAGAAGAGTVGADGVRTFQVSGDDKMLFSTKELTATAGDKIKVEFANAGTLPKQAMSHNWVLLKPMSDADIATFATAASAKPTEFLPDDLSKVLAHTKMLGPGEKDTITFNAPAEPGTYPYICTFPGHYALMRGTLTVKAK